MSDLRRQTGEVLDVIAGWNSSGTLRSYDRLGTEMATAAETLRRIEREADDPSVGSDRRDPATWLAPLRELADCLERDAAWLTEALEEGWLAQLWEAPPEAEEEFVRENFATLTPLRDAVYAALNASAF